MSIQFVSRAKAQLMGELIEAPVFQQTTSGSRFAKIKIQTVEHYLSKGERKTFKEVHDVTVFNKLGVDLLTSFGKPGIHFVIDGKIKNKQIEVSQYGGEIFVMTTGVDGDAPASSRSSSAASSSTQSGAGAAVGGATGSRASGGLGRIGTRSASQPSQNDGADDGYPSQASRSDTDLDDDIPF
ncbi:single-stranded DNA-binding protein [Agrobacterium rubi]|nr:single-stranded DNA-binding protein [Agrobacterium rubi]NTF24639.1 single-stranded DNA-binding protein [Agrobacterium rubi]